MTNTQHTPGPWTYKRDYTRPDAIGGDYFYDICDADGKPLNIVVFGEANARLIAAAPDMLEALKDIVENLSMQAAMQRYAPGLLAAAHAAIAKAEGVEG